MTLLPHSQVENSSTSSINSKVVLIKPITIKTKTFFKNIRNNSIVTSVSYAIYIFVQFKSKLKSLRTKSKLLIKLSAHIHTVVSSFIGLP